MASYNPSITAGALFTIIIITSITTINHVNATSPNEMMKLTHIRAYWQNDNNATAVVSVSPSPADDPFAFGSISITDDPLTVGPIRGSTLMGRAQGFYASTGQNAFALLMAMNFVFLDEKLNGSRVTILGKNEVPMKVREMPVVGGTRIFRMAKGYALLNTYFFDPVAAIAVVEYNIYIWHY